MVVAVLDVVDLVALANQREPSSLEYTRQALKATGYYIAPEFWEGEANSCCPPNPGI